MTINESVRLFLENIQLSRSENTFKTYKNGMQAFQNFLAEEEEISADQDVNLITEEKIAKFAKYLKCYSAATESLYINVVKTYFEFLCAERVLDLNLHQVKLLIRQRSRRAGVRLPQFPQQDIEKILEFAENLPNMAVEDEQDHLINLRDCAFLLTLADTGLRVHEACNLRRGDIEWRSKKAIIVGKGNKQAVIRFSKRSILAMRNYLSERGAIDGQSGKPLSSMPVFSRHDKGASKNVFPISTKTGRMIVSQRVEECLGKDAVGTITPHSFRHYFVTCVLHETGNLKIAQEFARHSNISVTQKYAHLSSDELDETYRDIFDS